MKRMVLLFLVFCLLTGCAAAPQPSAAATVPFTDSIGRTTALPASIDRIAITGPLSQLYILPLAGDLLVGISTAHSTDAAKYLPEEILRKEEIGQLYGSRGELDPEALLRAAPDVVIDIGEPKPSLAADLDDLTARTGIPFVHIDATVETAPQAYRMLGQLLGRQEKAEELAQWLENTGETIASMMKRVDADGARRQLVYCLGDSGTYVLAKGSFHAETIDLLADNAAVLEHAASSGLGNEVDAEQLLLWDPDVLLFAPDSCYDRIDGTEPWQSLRAVAEGRCYKTPTGPYGWLSSPPSVQRYLGMLWLGTLLYPAYADYDLQTEVTAYYRLFYGCTLTDGMYRELMADAL